MILIGERINAGFKDVKAAIEQKDKKTIQEWAKKQAHAKASYLDVNMGAVSNKASDLCWMIESVQEVTDIPISIDNSKIDILKEAVKVCQKPPLINSVTAVDDKMDEMFPLVKESGASIICLVMDASGSPKSADKRVENAGKIFVKAMEHGIQTENLFIDPIIMPLRYMQDQAKEILNAVKQFTLFSDPPPHIVAGLSNISNGTVHKKFINRVFTAMLIANGLDALICDVLDNDLIHTILTAKLVMNREIFADSFIEAFEK